MHLGQSGVIRLGRKYNPGARACPPGYNLYQSAPSTQRIDSWGSGYHPEWSCAPAPVAPSAPPPAPTINVSPTITASPAIQTQVSPQIAPVFSQLQDSPYAKTSGAPSMTTEAPQGANVPNPEMQRMKLDIQRMTEQARIDKEIRAENREIAEQEARIEKEKAQAAELRRLTEQVSYSDVVQDAYQVPQPISVPGSPITATSYYQAPDPDTISPQYSPPITKQGFNLTDNLPLLLIGGAGIILLAMRRGNKNETR